MKKKLFNIWQQILKGITLLIFFLICITFNSFAQEIKLMVVANSKSCPENLKFQELKSILLGEKQQWKDGTKIEIVLLEYKSQIGAITAKKVYGRTPGQLSKFWACTVFAGKASAPYVFESAAMLENYIAEHPGAIGLEEAKEQTALKQILVDGKASF